MATINYSFVKNSTGNILTFTSGSWVDTGLSEPLSYQNFVDKGIQLIENITQAQWSLLPDNTVELLTWGSMATQTITVTSNNNFMPYQLLDSPRLVNINTDNTYIPKAQITAFANMKMRFALSKDNKNTWYVYRNSSWSSIQISDIGTSGMTETEVNAIPSADLGSWFKRGTLDIAVWSYSESLSGSLALNSIQVDFPSNTSPLMDNLTLSTTTLGRTDVVTTATLRDLEGDQYRWRYALRSTAIPNNYAYQFGGGTKFTVANSTSLNSFSEMTIEFNINLKSLPTSSGWFPIIYKGTGGSTPTRDYSVWINATGDMGVYYGASTNWQMYVGTASTDCLTINTNYHIAVVFNPNKGYIRVYRNGILWRTGYVTQKIPQSTNPIYIGNTTESGYQNLNAILDEIRIWNRERTVTEILNNKDIVLKGTETNLVAYWKLDEGTGGINTIIKDSTNNANNATLTTVGTGVWATAINMGFDETKITEWSDWSNWYDAESVTNFTHTIPTSKFTIGNNYLVYQVQDERFSTFSSTVRTITMSDTLPVFSTITWDNWGLSGVIDDVDNDKIRYRILLNGVQKYPISQSGSTTWTDWLQVPYGFSYNWNPHDLIFGSSTNTIVIQVQDIVGGNYSYTINNLVGKYKNLMFKDATGYYSDDLAQVLKYLDFSSLTSGQTSSSAQIILENDFGYPLTNITLTCDSSQISNCDLQISQDSSFTPVPSSDFHSVNFSGVMQNGTQKTFYARIVTAISNNASSGIFSISASGEPV